MEFGVGFLEEEDPDKDGDEEDPEDGAESDDETDSEDETPVGDGTVEDFI